MLLDALSKIKRQSILTAILLMCLGIMLLLCPEEYITTLIILSGYIMIVYALEQTLEFLVNSTTTMSSILFIIAVVVGLVGLAVLVFHEDVLTVLSWIFGLLLMVDGIHSIYYAFTFAKRSGRKGSPAEKDGRYWLSFRRFWLSAVWHCLPDRLFSRFTISPKLCSFFGLSVLQSFSRL